MSVEQAIHQILKELLDGSGGHDWEFINYDERSYEALLKLQDLFAQEIIKAQIKIIEDYICFSEGHECDSCAGMAMHLSELRTSLNSLKETK